HLTGRKERVESTRDARQSTYAAPAVEGAPQTQVNVAVNGSAGSGRPERSGPGEESGESQTVIADNTYERTAPREATLADRQTTRDLERLFGRPLRIAGARLADQRVVAQLIADQPLDHFI